MQKKYFLISLLALTGCFGSSETAQVSTDDFYLWSENEFSISTPAGYERVIAGQTDLSLPEDFVAGYSEVRLDDNFATTVTIHRELLQADIASQTYALALRDAVNTATDYEEISFTEDENGDYVHVFTTKMPSANSPVRVTQKALTKSVKGWLVSCASVAEADPCSEIVNSFSLK